MTYKFSNNVSTLLYEELSPKASEMKVRKLPEDIHWPVLNTAEKEVAPCTVIDPKTRAWEIMYIKEIIEGPTYDTLKITRGEEETGPSFFNKNSRVEIRVTAAVLNDYYRMQVATPTRKGIVQVGDRLDVTSDGILSVPVATTEQAGAVKIGDRISLDSDTISVPLATDEVTGVIKVGENLEVDADGTLSVPNASTSEAGVVKLSDSFTVDDDGNLTLPIATETETGIVKVGDRLLIDSDGTLSAPLASDIDEGMVKIGDGLELDDNGFLTATIKELPIATHDDLGVVKVGPDMTIDEDGVLNFEKVATDEDLGLIRVGDNLIIDEDGKLTADAEAIVQSQIDDTQISSEHPWSSAKIHEELTTNSAATWGKYIEGKMPSDPEEQAEIIGNMPIGSFIVDDLTNPSAGVAPYNTEAWITSSGTWTAPVTGWYDVWLIGGGMGSAAAAASTLYPGSSGYYYSFIVHLTKGQKIPVTIGAGGIGNKHTNTTVQTDGSPTIFGGYSSISGYRFERDAWYFDVANINVNAGVAGKGYGGGTWTGSATGAAYQSACNGRFYGAGAGCMRYKAQSLAQWGNGAQGAVRLRYFDPTKSSL